MLVGLEILGWIIDDASFTTIQLKEISFRSLMDSSISKIIF